MERDIFMDLYLGRHQTAAEFGHSDAHLRSLLKSADTSRLAINGGDIIIYKTDSDDIRVFVKDQQPDTSKYSISSVPISDMTLERAIHKSWLIFTVTPVISLMLRDFSSMHFECSINRLRVLIMRGFSNMASSRISLV